MKIAALSPSDVGFFLGAKSPTVVGRGSLGAHQTVATSTSIRLFIMGLLWAAFLAGGVQWRQSSGAAPVLTFTRNPCGMRSCDRRQRRTAVVHTDVRDDDERSARSRRLACQPRSHAGGDGVDRRVLETGVHAAGNGVRVLAAQRAALAQCSWPQNRRC